MERINRNEQKGGMDMFTNTASIGNAVLKSATGLRKNYSIINENGEKVYINEKNRFKQRPVLKKNALLLFLYLHFLNPDTLGIVGIDIEDAAEFLQCTERTIKNNLRLLESKDYIRASFSTFTPGYYHIMLPEHKDYFKNRVSGGTGYSVITKDCFSKLLCLPDINSLRLALRNILPETEKAKRNVRRLEKSYREVQRDLPAYCTKSKIKDITKNNSFGELFHTKIKKRFIIIETRTQFNPAHTANAIRQDAADKILIKIEQINKAAVENNRHFKFHLTNIQMEDVANIALKIRVDYILSALDTVYNEYISHNIRVDNLPALIRTVAEFNSELSLVELTA